MQPEATVLSKYLINKPIVEELIARYDSALASLDTGFDEREEKIWQKCLKYPVLLSCVDAGMALLNPFSKIRYRIYIMFCILESTPEYADHFLPRRRSSWYIPVFLANMSTAAFKGIAGFILVKLFFNARSI